MDFHAAAALHISSLTILIRDKSHSGHSGAGMPVVRNPQFYFRNGFCWSDVLDPSNAYIKCRLKGNTVNDVKSMSLYDESGLGDKYFVFNINII